MMIKMNPNSVNAKVARSIQSGAKTSIEVAKNLNLPTLKVRKCIGFLLENEIVFSRKYKGVVKKYSINPEKAHCIPHLFTDVKEIQKTISTVQKINPLFTAWHPKNNTLQA